MKCLILIALLGFALLGAWPLLHGQILSDATGHFMDYGSFVHSVKAARGGLNPYSYHPEIRPAPFAHDALNLNPPISLVVFLPFSLVGTAFGFWLWRAMSLAVFVLPLGLLCRRHDWPYLRCLAIIALPALWYTLQVGQIYAALAGLTIIIWLKCEDGNDLVAGLLLGTLVAVRWQFGIWPLLLFISGRRSIAWPTIISFVTVSLLPVLLFGPGCYSQWVHLVSTEGSRLMPGWPMTNLSLVALTSTLFATSFGGMVLTGSLGIAFIFWALKYKPSIAALGAVALSMVLLAGPRTWTGYELFLVSPIVARPLNRLSVLALFMMIWSGIAGIGLILITASFCYDGTMRRSIWHHVTAKSTVEFEPLPTMR